jgi:hypothetical protein
MDIGEFRSNFLADFPFDGFVTIFAKLHSPAQRAVLKTLFFLVFSHQDALPSRHTQIAIGQMISST